MSDKETNKCKKAKQSLEAKRDRIKANKKWLKMARKNLIAIAQTTDKKAGINKRRIVLKGNNFAHEAFELYIDFVITAEDEDIEGAIVYGVLREPRYPYSIWANDNEKKEEKPLAFLSVNDQGKVSIKGKLDDEWWLSGKDKNEGVKAVQEMHHRVLDLIWLDALNWGNEPLLP